MARAPHVTTSKKLSVMMPARNAERTIRTAITSTLRAMPGDSELLVLDDASEDATGDIVRKLMRKDGRLGLIGGHRTALGIPEASNALLANSTAPFFARMDSDDITLPLRFRRQLRDIRSTDFNFCSTVFYGPGRWLVEPVPVLSSGVRSSLYELIVHDPFFHSALLGRRSVIDEMGGYRDVPSEDWDLFMRLGVAGGRMTRSALPGIAYRRHPTQITKRKDWKASVVNSAPMAEAHEALCEYVLGHRPGAFRALAGEGASHAEAVLAEQVIDEVKNTEERFSRADELSLKVTTHGVKIRLHGRYPAVFAHRS